MNRAVLLLVAAAALAGGLIALVALDPGAREAGPADPGEAPAAPAEVPAAPEAAAPQRPAALADVAQDRKFDPVTGEGPALSWEVIVLNDLGQPLPEASIVATRTGDELTGTGREKWEAVPSGPWSLTVELEGYPTWRREVIVESKKRLRTVARLGDELRVQGTVVDAFGAPITGLPVYFLPKGVGHPSSRDLVRDPENPRKTPQPKNGAISAELLPGGRIKAKLPGDGEWRVSVGRPSEPRWTQAEGEVLTHGGPDHLDVTVPAMGRVRFEFKVEGAERPRQVSAHVFDPEHAAAVMRSRMQQGDDRSVEMMEEMAGSNENGRDNAKMLSKLEEKQAAREAARQAGTAKPIKLEMSNSVKEVREEARAAGTRAPAFEPGWRMVKSARPDVNGVAELTGLPLDTQIRLLFIRGKEQTTTASGFSLRDGRPQIGTASLPPLETTPAAGPDNRATVALEPSPSVVGGEREVGVRWSY